MKKSRRKTSLKKHYLRRTKKRRCAKKSCRRRRRRMLKGGDGSEGEGEGGIEYEGEWEGEDGISKKRKYREIDSNNDQLVEPIPTPIPIPIPTQTPIQQPLTRSMRRFQRHSVKLQRSFDRHPPFSGVLKMECNNPSNCLALGKYDTLLKTYFNNFKDLSLVDNSNLKKLGDSSLNGFVIELPFVRGGYTAYTVLKCATKTSADNLFYEAVVGAKFINTYLKKLPCFVETYECYTFNSERDWSNLLECAKTNTFTNIDIQSMLTKFIPDGTQMDGQQAFNKSCEQNKLSCVLIQHFNNIQTLDYEYKNNRDNIKYDIYNLLYQVYYALAYLQNLYTHYDLHGHNVLLYKPYDGKQYITMQYHRNGIIYEFKTEYICKIIDYGRNYINVKETSNSAKITTQDIITDYICKSEACTPNYVPKKTRCGVDVGYKMTGRTSNLSADVRLACLFSKMLRAHKDPYTHFNMCTSIKCDDIIPAQNKSMNLDNIANIYAMRNSLERHMGSNIRPKFNALYSSMKYNITWKQAAIMKVFDDGRPYTFTEV